MDQLMFPLYFHYENISRQYLLLKPNHTNVMEVPGSCKIIVVPKTVPSIKNGKLAMEIPCGQKLLQTQRASTGKLSKLQRKSSFARVRNRCIYTGRPRSVYDKNLSYPFSWISISRSFYGHKEIVLVATTKPIEQGLAPQQVYKQGK